MTDEEEKDKNMLMEELFSRGIMTMGPSPADPERQVGIFAADFVARLPLRRAEELKKFSWLPGEWRYENHVPAGRLNPAYTEKGIARFSFRESDNWICSVAPDGRETPHITFDPFSEQWIYLLMRGAYGMLRSREGWRGERLIFSGLMTMLGIDTEWRLTWTREGDDRFSFTNEERLPDNSWAFIDNWTFVRR